jgi:gas vesicle protein
MENRTGATAPPAEESVDRAKSAAETTLSDVKQVARDTASALKTTVKDEGEAVKQKAMQAVSDAQTKAADQARTAANTLRDTANRLDGDLPWMNTALNKTADGLERVTNTLNTGDMKQTVHALTQFARNHPALFLGLSVAAGFALARVGKTAMESAHAGDTQQPDAGQGLVDEAVTPYAPMSEV